jgi:hypothetical protein
MVKQTEAISRFLIKSTHSDLSNLYNPNMEVQVNVARDNGNRVEGDYQGRKWTGWTDDIETWKSFRIPYHANTNPEYPTDKEIKFNLDQHVDGIGMTGWDWANRVSRWVAFDFDAIIGHSDKHSKKLLDTELQNIEKVVSEIPWVTLRYSTSGKGLHLYVFLNEVPTANHNEHAALARAILGILSAITGFDFQSKVDICGGNMWVWHRKMKGTNGLQLIKEGTVLEDVPSNWRDHVAVVSGRKPRLVPQFIEESTLSEAERLFEELSGQRSKVSLDDEHKKLINFLQETKANWWWDQDHNMLVTHTWHLKEAYDALQARGIYSTLSTGRERGIDHNCFLYPLRNGGWVVRRYSPGVKESDNWDQDGAGWTRCYFNVSPDLKMAARACGGLEDPTAGGYIFREGESAQKAALMLGVDMRLPNLALARETKLKEHKDGRLSVEVKHSDDDQQDKMSGWLNKKGQWRKLFNTKISTPVESEIGNYDDLVRHLVTDSNEDYGWVVKSDERWRREPLRHVQLSLEALGLKPQEINKILGSGIGKPWTVVNRPFQPEYVGDRQWNRDTSQLRFTPSQNLDNLQYDHWRLILNHVGKGLDSAIAASPWAKANGITTGAEYVKCWLASLLQAPTEPLPYLFLYGPQDSGKSILHEAMSILISKGVEPAASALVNQSGFNAEIETAVLCYIEETDLNRNKVAYNRIKDWVTSRRFQVHRKGQTPYTIVNTTHWIQCANSREFCPIFPGDTRITMIFVDELDPTQKIPKKVLLQKLEKEAPDFLAALVNLELPPSNDRLNVPVIATEDKKQAEMANRTLLQMFLDEHCYYVKGETVSVANFHAAFIVSIEPQYAEKWSKVRVGREMPKHFPKGRNPKDGQWHFGNLSFVPFDPAKNPEQPELIVVGDKLVPNDKH